MKKLLILFTLVIFGCSFPVQLTLGTPTPTPTPTQTPAPSETPLATPQPGTEQNPLILALAPSARGSQAMVDAGNALAAHLERLTGYRIVTTAPTSEEDLINSLSLGNVHIAVLTPFGYLQARENGLVIAALANVINGVTFYGGQFIVNRESEFASFYDEVRGENTAEAEEALAQFTDKKPCWSDIASPSGHVVPLGLLNQAQVTVRSGAFLEGQGSVVRAVYAADICDFGATFIDARKLPALEGDYPDVLEKVRVVWQIPEVIPYENVSFATSVPLEMRRVLLRAFVDVMLIPEGKAAVQTVYGLESLEPVEDELYTAFADYVEASRLNLMDLINAP